MRRLQRKTRPTHAPEDRGPTCVGRVLFYGPAYSSPTPLCLRLRHGRLVLSSCTPPVWRGNGTRGFAGFLTFLGRGDIDDWRRLYDSLSHTRGPRRPAVAWDCH